MSNTIVITDIDHVTVNGQACGSITNVLLNKNATAQEVHDALAAYVAALQAQITTQTTAASTATAALNTLQGNVDSIVEQGIAANGDAGKLVVALNLALPLSSASILAAKKKALADAQAIVVAAQAAVDAHQNQGS